MAQDRPEVIILVLGDAGVGKSAFLSRLALGHKPLSRAESESLPPYSLPSLRDLDQPFAFDIELYNRPYRFLFYDTASPTNYTILRPSFIVLAYDISCRSTLFSLGGNWRHLLESQLNYDETLPVMVLGLKRDLRREWQDDQDPEKKSVMPQEGLRVAQEMRCDRYAECSALTGELCREVLEDIAMTAAKTTTEKGGRSEGNCNIM